MVIGAPFGIARLPLSFLFKDHYGISAAGIALVSALISIPFYLKPVVGFLSDTKIFPGSMRQQLVVGSFITTVLWLLTGAAAYRSLYLLLFILPLLTTSVVVVNTTLGGLLVIRGQAEGANGRLAAVRAISQGAGEALSGSIGGFLASRAFGWTGVGGAICFLAVATIVLLTLAHEDPAPRNPAPHLWKQFQEIRQSRTLWMITGILFLVLIAPGFHTALIFYQTDVLHFSKQLIGNLTFINGLSGLVGACIYAILCRKLEIRYLLYSGITIYMLSTLSYLFYHSEIQALLIEAAGGFGIAMAGLPVLDLASRSCPIGLEATGYGLVLSMTNITLSLSDILGAHLYSNYHFAFSTLVLLNPLTTLLAIPFILRLPLSLTRQHDTISG